MLLLLALVVAWQPDASAQFEEPLQAALEGSMPRTPYAVRIGVQIEQIVSIQQKEESFEVVGNLRLQWEDPRLAFDAGKHGRPFKMLTREEFARFAEQNVIFTPVFTMHNQQGERFTQNAGVLIFSEGHATYGERFTVRLQAPEFQFAQYPFDTQRFFIRVHSLLPVTFMTFVPLEGFSRLGDSLGEEEWLFEKSWTKVSEAEGVTGTPTSHFSFGFEAHRQLNYYVLRIFVPLGIIILVSWLTFFQQDFGKRIDLAGANLLIFVALNFTISDNLPRLGYLTFMDTIVAATFVFSALVVIVNVFFKRMEVMGKEALARRIDNYTLWIYPATLAALVLTCWYWFMVRQPLA